MFYKPSDQDPRPHWSAVRCSSQTVVVVSEISVSEENEHILDVMISKKPQLCEPNLRDHWTTEYSELEGTHKNHQKSTPGPSQDTPKFHHVTESIVQKLLELWIPQETGNIYWRTLLSARGSLRAAPQAKPDTSKTSYLLAQFCPRKSLLWEMSLLKHNRNWCRGCIFSQKPTAHRHIWACCHEVPVDSPHFPILPISQPWWKLFLKNQRLTQAWSLDIFQCMSLFPHTLLFKGYKSLISSLLIHIFLHSESFYLYLRVHVTREGNNRL